MLKMKTVFKSTRAVEIREQHPPSLMKQIVLEI